MIPALDLPALMHARNRQVILRRAVESDLPAIMSLLADDPVSAARGDRADPGDEGAYRSALRDVIGDASNELLVVVDGTGDVIATMQLTRIPGLARRGSTRLLVEAVRVRGDQRSSGIGSAMMHWVTETAAAAVGASLVQLTSDESRTDAHRFYERLGFVGSHRGFKFAVP